MPTYASSPQGYVIGQGEAAIITFSPDSTVTDKSISGWAIAFVLRAVISSSSASALITKTTANGGVSIISAADGTWKVTLTNANTMAMPVGLYDWEAWRTDSGAETKIAFGKIEIIRSVQYPV